MIAQRPGGARKRAVTPRGTTARDVVVGGTCATRAEDDGGGRTWRNVWNFFCKCLVCKKLKYFV